ncbi:MAG: hydroxysqualene dehydroxylase HpnE [Pseudomonadota bacterium]
MADAGAERPAHEPGEGGVHIVGAGLAGLSAALVAAKAGRPVTLWEAAGHAGGRCRSFHDARLDRLIDNGSHLILTGNDAVARYLERAGTPDALVPGEAAFPMVDLDDGARFTLRLSEGPIPWWILDPASRVPGTRALDYLGGWRLALAGPGVTVAEAVRGRGPLWRAFWEPLTLAVLNTTPERGQARLLWRVLRATFLKGAGPSRPMFAPEGLGHALVSPALERLTALGAAIRFNTVLRGLDTAGGRVQALDTSAGHVPVGPHETVILALPPSRLVNILPDLSPPRDDGAILNAHFVVDAPELLAQCPPLTGVLGSLAQWIFVRGDVVSVTVSAADALGIIATPRDQLVSKLWAETRTALALGETNHTCARIIVEKRATFDQSPEGVAKRLSSITPLRNVFLAGDSTDTGLPATIEGAVLSGETAAKHALNASQGASTAAMGRE